jgi:hypothetical protein
MEMHRKPTIDCTQRETQGLRAEWWTLSLAHYEEAIPNLQWLHNCDGRTGPMILHRHPWGRPCNGDCHLIWWAESEKGGETGGVNESGASDQIPCTDTGCDIAFHNCPGCRAPIPHGIAGCDTCNIKAKAHDYGAFQ